MPCCECTALLNFDSLPKFLAQLCKKHQRLLKDMLISIAACRRGNRPRARLSKLGSV